MTSTPFLIRGHHLSVYAELASWRADPRALARSLVESRLHERQGSEEKQAYSQDVVGTTQEEAELVASRYRTLFTTFEELGQDDLIVITTGAKDGICESCVIGDHCSNRGFEMAAETEHGALQVYESDFQDMRSISAFKKLAGRLAAQGKLDPELGSPSIAEVPAPTADATPILKAHKVDFEPPLQAGAGYVKAVLSHWGLAQQLRY